MKKKIFFHKNQSDQIISHIFTHSLFRNDNINRKYNSNIRKFENHTKSYICFDTFEDPGLLLCSHTIGFQSIRVGTRINGNFDWPLRDSITLISQQKIDQLPLNRIDCLQKMNSSFRNSSIVVNSSTVSTSINRENGNTLSIAQLKKKKKKKKKYLIFIHHRLMINST